MVAITASTGGLGGAALALASGGIVGEGAAAAATATATNAALVGIGAACAASIADMSESSGNHGFNKHGKQQDRGKSSSSNKFEKGNYDKVKDNYLKRKGIDAHELKKDFLGKKASISEYDIYVNKDTGELFILKKGGNGVGIPTGEFIK